jgi:MYXO-CTERM domain-containing protein
MKTSRICAVALSTLAIVGAAASAKADPQTGGQVGGTVVLNTYHSVLPKLIGDALGPTKKDASGNLVPRVGRCTGVGYMNATLKLDDSPTAAAGFASDVPLLFSFTRTDNKVNNNSNNSYMQGGFAVVHVTKTGPQVDAMQEVDFPRLDGDRTASKPMMVATNKYYLDIAAAEDNGQNNNPQVVAWVIDKTTLKLVKVTNSNRQDSTLKPTNLIELSGKNDNQQYGPHSIARVQGTDNAFVMGVQRNNNNAYVLRVDVVDDAANGGVKLDVKYLNRVIQNAQHCRPDVVSNAADGKTAFLTSVEANNQPADIGVRLLSFDVDTGKVIKSVLIAKSDPKNNKYMVQPNISDLGTHIAVSYQESAAVRGGPQTNNNGHGGGYNVSQLALFDKATLSPAGTAMQSVAPYARHAASTGTMWGEAGKEMPVVLSLAGSATGMGAAFLQVVPMDTATNLLGTKDPLKLYKVATYSDVAGTVVRGLRNPNNQGRGWIYAQGGIPNPGYNQGNTAFMPEVKTLIGSAVQGYTTPDTAKLAARESIYLSLVPASWIPGTPTVPGGPTGTPGVGPDGKPSLVGPLPRVNAQGTSTDPNAAPPESVIPGGDSPDPNSGAFHNGLDGASSGCSVSSNGTSGGTGGGLVLVGLGMLLALRRKQEGK